MHPIQLVTGEEKRRAIEYHFQQILSRKEDCRDVQDLIIEEFSRTGCTPSKEFLKIRVSLRIISISKALKLLQRDDYLIEPYRKSGVWIPTRTYEFKTFYNPRKFEHYDRPVTILLQVGDKPQGHSLEALEARVSQLEHLQNAGLPPNRGLSLPHEG
jgi:hypothetical protein